MTTKELIKNLQDDKFSEFRKGYKETMKEKRNESEEIVKKYVYNKISLNKDTMI